MSERKSFSPEETARLGEEIYEKKIRSQVEAGNRGKIVAFDVESGAYAIEETAVAAARRLRLQHPDAEIWFVRVGHRALHHMGGRSFEATVIWEGQRRLMEADGIIADPLMGMSMISGYKLSVEAIVGGCLTIETMT